MCSFQCWAAILKNVSFKAIQIHNFWEKNRIKRYNLVRQNFCHRWSDRKNQTTIFLHWWSDKICKILCYKATFLSKQTYFPSDEATQSVQKPIFWSDAAIQYPKVQKFHRWSDVLPCLIRFFSIFPHLMLPPPLHSAHDLRQFFACAYTYVRRALRLWFDQKFDWART